MEIKVSKKQGSMHRRTFLGNSGAFAMMAATSTMSNAQTLKPIRVGGSLPLTGPLAAVGTIHKIASEMFVEQLNKRGGLLGRPVEWVLLDDQSQSANTRTLYERLITAEKVDLLMGPYGTSSILAAMGAAQRYGKLFIQSSLGDPSLAPYDLQFPSLPLGPDPRHSDTEILLDAWASTKTPPKTISFVTSKFPSALDLAKGGLEVADKRGLKTILSLEYEFGTRDFGTIAARIKDANADLLWIGALGLEATLILDAMKKLDYMPPRQFYLFPAPGPTVMNSSANGITTLTWFEEHEPFTKNAGAAEFIALYNQKATAAGLPWPHVDYQAAVEYAAWQILEAAAIGSGGIDDKAMAAWLKKNQVSTVVGIQTFDGKFNSGPVGTKIKQVQDGKWVAVWPPEVRPTGVKFVAP
jgi:branched-chain amino acid transport system substrate-binding protein